MSLDSFQYLFKIKLQCAVNILYLTGSGDGCDVRVQV